MSDDYENFSGRHRFGSGYTGPVTFRDLMREANWAVVVTILSVAGFWCFVGYRIAQWWPW